MSSRRSIVWLLFFITLAVLAHVLVSTRYGRAVPVVRANVLVPGADRASLVEFVRPGVPSAVLLRSEDWRLIAPFPASVNRASVLRVLDTLAFAPVSDVLTEGEMHRLGRTRRDFGLDDPPLRLAVRRESGEIAVGFGGKTPAGDGVYAFVSDRPGICVVSTDAFARLDLPLDVLRDPRVLATDGGDPVSLDVRRPAGRFVRVGRLASGAWQMQEPTPAPVSGARVAALVNLLAGSRAGRFVWPVAGESAAAAPSVSLLAGYGLDAESAVTVSLSGADGASHFVTFGKKADGAAVYALVQDGRAIVTVPVGLRDRILVEADSLVDLRIFPVEESAVATLSIADGGLTYLVARSPGGDWRLDSPVSAPADQDAVRALVRTILALRTTERDPKGLVVSLTTNTPPVAVSRDAILVQNRLEDLRSKTVLRMPAEKIRRVTATAADGRVQSADWDAANRTWLLAKPEGASLDGLALATVLGALDPLTARAVVRLRIAAAEAGKYGLERPRFTLAIDPLAEGAVRRNLLIGNPAPDGGSYATVGSTDAVVILPDETVRALTTRFSSVERE